MKARSVAWVVLIAGAGMALAAPPPGGRPGDGSPAARPPGGGSQGARPPGGPSHGAPPPQHAHHPGGGGSYWYGPSVRFYYGNPYWWGGPGYYAPGYYWPGYYGSGYYAPGSFGYMPPAYVYGPPGVVTSTGGVAYIEREDGTVSTQPAAPEAAAALPATTPPPGGQWWYLCDSPRGAYPYVRECPGGWERVPAVPPDAVK